LLCLLGEYVFASFSLATWTSPYTSSITRHTSMATYETSAGGIERFVGGSGSDATIYFYPGVSPIWGLIVS